MADEYVLLTPENPRPHWDYHINALHRDMLVAGADRSMGGHRILHCTGILDGNGDSILPTYASSYDFTPIAPGVSITAGVPVTVTLPSVPPGINGTDVGHYVYLSGGTGTAEAVLLTGGTAVSGGTNQTIQFTPAYNHSGAWAISSATDGVQEAIVASGADIFLQDSITLYGPLTFPAAAPERNVRLIGRGRIRTIFTIDPSFPTTVDGVFIFHGSEPGPVLEEFAVIFFQPDSADIGDYTQWPPFVYAPSCPRFVLRNITVYRAWNGVYTTSNSGGCVIEGLWMSAFNKGLQFDGALDTVRIRDCHFWPWGCTTAQLAAYHDADVLAMEIGRIDDLKISGTLFLSGSSIRFWAGAGGTGAFASIDACGFDTRSKMTIEKGSVSMSNSYFSAAADMPGPSLVITGGRSMFSNCQFVTLSATQVMIDVTLTSGDLTSIQMNVCKFQTLSESTSRPVLASFEAPSGIHSLNISNSIFVIPAVAYTEPAVDVVNNTGAIRVTFQGNHHSDMPGGTKWLRIATDDTHRVFGNIHGNTGHTLPATKTLGLYQVSDGELVFPSAMNVNIPNLTTP
jgi:hypothetical protein